MGMCLCVIVYSKVNPVPYSTVNITEKKRVPRAPIHIYCGHISNALLYTTHSSPIMVDTNGALVLYLLSVNVCPIVGVCGLHFS